MGMPILSSSCGCGGCSMCLLLKPPATPATSPRSRAPSPVRFEIDRIEYDLTPSPKSHACVALVRYPDATNYEGRKVLVFRAAPERVYHASYLDPHFCDNGQHLSPFARFEPTDLGWQAAVLCARMLAETVSTYMVGTPLR